MPVWSLFPMASGIPHFRIKFSVRIAHRDKKRTD
jgi:hypothetical protein